MRLTASLGSAAKYWSASVIFVCPVNRKTERVFVFRMAAMTGVWCIDKLAVTPASLCVPSRGCLR